MLTLKQKPKALYLAAVWEVWILTPTILLGLFLRWVSFFTPLAYFQFLRFRYLLSPSTRSVVHEADARIEGTYLSWPLFVCAPFC